MGSGKTTLCKALARLTGIRTVDLDDYIAGVAGMSIRQYFDLHGEAAFRQLETKCLETLAETADDTIIACGGGTPCFNNNMAVMNSRGTTITLDTPIEVLHSRLMRGRHKRPLIASLDDTALRRFIIAKLAEREPFYSLSTHRFESTLLENEQEIDITAKRFIELFLRPQ